jgi:hypothetical protein
MQSTEMIRRQWPGFGECRITISRVDDARRGTLADWAFAGVPRLLSRTGFGSLSFTIDPAWIAQEKPVATPMVRQFLRVHRRELAAEWKSRQTTVAPVETPIESPEPPRAARRLNRVQPERAYPTGDKALPSWFDTIKTGVHS